jgi:hypothetical protein
MGRCGLRVAAIACRGVLNMAGKDYLNDVQECEKKPLWQRIGWLLVIWTASVASLAVFAMLVRLFMSAAGMKSH